MIKPHIIKQLYYLLLPGAAAGYYLFKIEGSGFSGKIFGILLIIGGLSELFKHDKKENINLK